MSRIFLSHSSANNAEAIALRDWLVAQGWSDLFLDLDPNRGIAAGERWERALNEAARRCEAVLFLISKAWLASRWCMNELTLARRLNKRLFGVLVEEGIATTDLPAAITGQWQLVNLATGRDHRQFRVRLPVSGEELHVTYSHEGLARLKAGLQRAGLHASYFAWPPETDPKRAPYRGLRPLETDDAGIFFGREAPVIEAIDRLRGLTEAAPPRLFVILGASGAGKSSFLRAGLLPRMERDSLTFMPLPVIRPERAAVSGETGLVAALTGAFEAASLKVARGEIREAVAGGATTLKLLLTRLQLAAQPPDVVGQALRKPPTLVIAIDQGDELLLAETQSEALSFLALLRGLSTSDNPAVITILTIRSDNYERLQSAAELDDVHKFPFDLGPMPKGSYAEVVKGPIHRLEGTARAIKIADALVDALLADIEAGGAKDTLPLLAFTLERLYEEYGATGHLTLAHFIKLGRVKGSIEAAVERAFTAADKDSRIPRDHEARLTLLRRGLIPWLAGIDPDTKAPRRRVARRSEIPAEARPLIDLLVEQRLLSIDVAQDTGETTIEPTHDALLRQWGLLQGWLMDDTGLLTVLDGIKRAARDWAANAKASSWLAHSADRLRAATNLMARPDLAANLEPADRAYVAACRDQEKGERRRALRDRLAVGVLAAILLALVLLGHYGLLDPLKFMVQARTLADRYGPTRALSAAQERALEPGNIFKECANCPEMVVLPAGDFIMGSPDSEEGHQSDESPQHKVTIPALIAVGRFAVTFDQWDACVAAGGCERDLARAKDEGWGRGQRPVIYVSWYDAQEYLIWLTKQTGNSYRLLTEAEWEYAARAGTVTRYWWGEMVGENNANCGDCKSHWDTKQTAPVGQFKPNNFGLYDVHGNVLQWVQDCYNRTAYDIAPTVRSESTEKKDCDRVIRGGSWYGTAARVRAAARTGNHPDNRGNITGFRVARALPGARKK